MPKIGRSRRRHARAIVLLAALATPAFLTASLPAPLWAQESVVPQADAAERAKTREELFDALKAAPNAEKAQQIVAQIWQFWFQAPDADAASLMNEVQDRRRMLDLPTALKLLDQLVAEAPDWAEAWNQRATIRFMMGDYSGSLADIDRVLPLEPKHFGALSGEAIILLQLGRAEEAQTVLKRAVTIDPFLPERALLKPEPKGRDI